MINAKITNWRKASYSTEAGTNCVETGWTAATVGYRDSKQPNGPELRFPTDAAATFVACFRDGTLTRA